MIAAASALIEQRRASRARVLVAIDGCGGAGKSTLARGVSNSLTNVSIVCADDFFRPLSQPQPGTLTPAKAYELYFPWERMRDEALVPLRQGKTARYQRHDWVSDELGEWVIVEPNPIVIVEGVYSSRPELRESARCDHFHRRSARRAPPPDAGAWSSRQRPESDWMIPWMAAEDWYVEHLRPQESADLILKNE